jgi:hypothetical protein
MYLQERVEYFNGSQYGFEDFGSGPNYTVPEPNKATQALVMLLSGMEEPFKIPVAYFFLKGANADKRIQLVC